MVMKTRNVKSQFGDWKANTNFYNPTCVITLHSDVKSGFNLYSLGANVVMRILRKDVA